MHHASRLKSHDVQFKRATRAARFLNHCDLSEEEDNATHLIMQCPMFQHELDAMCDELRPSPDGSNTTDTLLIRLAKQEDCFLTLKWSLTG